MNSNLLRNLSFHTRPLRLSPFNRSLNPTLSLLSLPTASSFFSSQSDPPLPSHTQKKQDPIVEEISNEEFKRRVARLQEGDEDAIPSLFEAIMQRYLTDKPIEADPELMKEILGKGTISESEEDEEDEDDEEEEWDSDLEGMSDIDYEDRDFDHGSKGRSAGRRDE